MGVYDLIRVERKVTLPYPKQKVLSDIKRLCEVSNGKFRIDEENDTFGTLKISTMNGLQVYFMDITLSETDENNTSFSLTAYNAAGSNGAQAVIEGNVGNFLKLVEMKLKGETITKEIVKEQAGGSGWIWVFIAIIISIIIFASL
jgi:hypothetical protein